MTLEEYLKQMNELVESNPEALKYKVIVAADEEGNNYMSSINPATVVYVEDADAWRIEGIVSEEDFEDHIDEDEYVDWDKVVLIN